MMVINVIATVKAAIAKNGDISGIFGAAAGVGDGASVGERAGVEGGVGDGVESCVNSNIAVTT